MVPLNESFNLTWNPPFAMDGIDPYYLVTTTVFTERATQLIFSNETSEDRFVVRADDSSNCTLYELCVQAATDAGLGKKTCVNTTLGVEGKAHPNKHCSYILHSRFVTHLITRINIRVPLCWKLYKIASHVC